VRRSSAVATSLVAASVIWLAPALAAPTSTPTKAEIATAVKQAEHSSKLWATINLCNPKHHKGSVGVRAEMPALGFSSELKMTFRLEYYSASAHKYVPVPRSTRSYVAARKASTGLYQFGVQYSFASPVTLIGKVELSWVLKNKVLGSKTVTTTAHHPSVDDGDPPHHSVAACTT
jgi:hypothetical protein